MAMKPGEVYIRLLDEETWEPIGTLVDSRMAFAPSDEDWPDFKHPYVIFRDSEGNLIESNGGKGHSLDLVVLDEGANVDE